MTKEEILKEFDKIFLDTEVRMIREGKSIYETNGKTIKDFLIKSLDSYAKQAVNIERERIWTGTKKISWRVSTSPKIEYNVHRKPLKEIIFNNNAQKTN